MISGATILGIVALSYFLIKDSPRDVGLCVVEDDPLSVAHDRKGTEDSSDMGSQNPTAVISQGRTEAYIQHGGSEIVKYTLL